MAKHCFIKAVCSTLNCHVIPRANQHIRCYLEEIFSELIVDLKTLSLIECTKVIRNGYTRQCPEAIILP